MPSEPFDPQGGDADWPPSDWPDPGWADSFDGTFDANEFSGTARMFPLPGVSLYPGIVRPYHVFEERYLALVEDALAGDGLIAMGVLCPDWETDYEGRPPMEPVACLGKIVAHFRFEEGRFNLMLAGLRRITIKNELEPPQAFRRAAVELVEECEPEGGGVPAVADLQSRLATAFRTAMPAGEPPEPLLQVLEADTPLGTLADLTAYTLPFSHGVKLAALAEADAVRRAEGLIAALDDEDLAASGLTRAGFPPPFSTN